MNLNKNTRIVAMTVRNLWPFNSINNFLYIGDFKISVNWSVMISVGISHDVIHNDTSIRVILPKITVIAP